jgi:hypothetical protein
MSKNPPSSFDIVPGLSLSERPRTPAENGQTVMYVPLDCVAMIRLPIPLPAFAIFAKAVEQAAPGCVVTQHGEFFLALRNPQKEGA